VNSVYSVDGVYLVCVWALLCLGIFEGFVKMNCFLIVQKNEKRNIKTKRNDLLREEFWSLKLSFVEWKSKCIDFSCCNQRWHECHILDTKE